VGWSVIYIGEPYSESADEHRPGVPRKVTDDHVEPVVIKTLAEKPVGATH
jgi:hypothetical protein